MRSNTASRRSGLCGRKRLGPRTRVERFRVKCEGSDRAIAKADQAIVETDRAIADADRAIGRREMGLLFEDPDAQGAEGDGVAVVLEGEVALGVFVELLPSGELGFGEEGFPFPGGGVHVGGGVSVEGEFDAGAGNEDAAFVPFAGGLGEPGFHGDEAIESAREIAGFDFVRVAGLGVGIEDLILGAGFEGRFAVLRDMPHDARVPISGDLELEAEFEVRELRLGEQVAAALSGEDDGTVPDLPLGGNGILLEAAESLQRFAVEDEFETVGLLLLRERVRLGGRRGQDKGGKEGQNGGGFHDKRGIRLYNRIPGARRMIPGLSRARRPSRR